MLLTVSWPQPRLKRYTSLSASPLRVSLPAPPSRMSLPVPPYRLSLPSPPSSMSLPLPPCRRSLPAPPSKKSTPSLPYKLSLPASPNRKSELAPPCKVLSVTVSTTKLLPVPSCIFSSSSCWLFSCRTQVPASSMWLEAQPVMPAIAELNSIRSTMPLTGSLPFTCATRAMAPL
ncbi:hypothetical protein D3C76_1107490 [compost metagenome]